MTLSPISESTTYLGHYGLIAGVFDELGISDLIDDLLPKKSGHNISHSTVLKAMCINGLAKGQMLNSLRATQKAVNYHSVFS